MKVENFSASEDYLNFGSSVYKPEAGVTVADSALAGAKNLSSALDVVAQLTVGPVNAAVFIITVIPMFLTKGTVCSAPDSTAPIA